MGGIVDDEFPRRRDPDDTVLPVVMLKVEERLREDRHAFRNEMAAIAATQQIGIAQASKEHAEVRADIGELMHKVEPIPGLVEKVDRLEQADTFHAGHKAATDDLRKLGWRFFGAMVAVIGAATAILALLNHP